MPQLHYCTVLHVLHLQCAMATNRDDCTERTNKSTTKGHAKSTAVLYSRLCWALWQSPRRLTPPVPLYPCTPEAEPQDEEPSGQSARKAQLPLMRVLYHVHCVLVVWCRDSSAALSSWARHMNISNGSHEYLQWITRISPYGSHEYLQWMAACSAFVAHLLDLRCAHLLKRVVKQAECGQLRVESQG